MKQKTARRILLFGFLIALLTGLIGTYSESKLLILVMIILCFSLLIFQLVFNRFPHCGQYLGKYYGKFCQHCGKPLDED